jgi:hypothetical protein
VPDVTYTLETITLTNCNILFKTIRLIKKKPGDRILARLKAISGLYSAAIHNNLSAKDLPIKTLQALNLTTTNTTHYLI